MTPMPHTHNKNQAVVTEMVCSGINVPASTPEAAALSVPGIVDVVWKAISKSHERPRDTGNR
ncbi:hypothetical protein D3C76_1704520 [compost metagenome]